MSNVSFISYLKKDLRGTIHYSFYRLNNVILSKLSSLYCRLKMSFQGITYGKKVLFRGNALFSKYPGTTINIGNGCSFNSSSRHNYRGLNHRCIIQTGPNGNIQIGDNCGFSGTSIVSSCGITIGSNLTCGANVMIGDRNDHEDEYPQFMPEPVVIGNHVWIGMNSVIMKGVTIGDNVIIGANSVVTRDIPSNTIAAGIPCKVIKEI